MISGFRKLNFHAIKSSSALYALKLGFLMFSLGTRGSNWDARALLKLGILGFPFSHQHVSGLPSKIKK